MRLKKLGELIHSSTAQSGLSNARVTIHFKEIRDLPNDSYEEIPNSEFTLCREVSKNNSSRYFFNGKPLQFEELGEILDTKGIDIRHNRFLILQGEVEQISMMKPKAVIPGEIGLLEFLEDIIGTSRFVPLIEQLTKDIDNLSEIKTQKANRVKVSESELEQLEEVKNIAINYYEKEKELYYFSHLEIIVKLFHLFEKKDEEELKIKAYQEKLSQYDANIKEKLQANISILSVFNEKKKSIKLIDE